MSNIKNNVKQFYNEAGAYFSKSRQKTYGNSDATWQETRPYLQKLSENSRILDLGCGNGRLLTGIEKPINYIGIDFSEKLLSEAKDLHSNKRFVLGDITNEDTWNNLGTSDAIFCIATMHHLPTKKDQLFVLEEIEKHLDKNGFAYLTFWNLLNKKVWGKHLNSFGLKLKNIRWVKVPFKNKWDRFLFTFSKNYLKKLIKNVDLNIDKLYYCDKNGKETNFLNGRNLVIVLKHKPE